MNRRDVAAHAPALSLLLLLLSPATAQTVTDTIQTFGFSKHGFFDQTGPAAVAVDNFTFRASAFQEPSPLHTVNAMDVRWTDSAATPHTEPLSLSGSTWSHSDQGPYPSQGALTAMYPATNDYQLDIDVVGFGLITESIDGPDDLWPDRIPEFSNYSTIIAADPAGPVTATFDAWIPDPLASPTKSRVALFDSGGFVWDEPGDHTMTSATIPAGTMIPGEEYRLILEHESRHIDVGALAVFTDSGVNFTFKYTTEITFTAVPAPPTLTLALTTLLATTRRRR